MTSVPTHYEAESAASTSALVDRELATLRARWDAVQAGFVDDPGECIEQAEGLVSELLGQLMAGFTEARSLLEEQWERGDQATTEDLRIAAKRYREFLDRLLAV